MHPTLETVTSDIFSRFIIVRRIDRERSRFEIKFSAEFLWFFQFSKTLLYEIIECVFEWTFTYEKNIEKTQKCYITLRVEGNK